jgi:ABC-type antimicrobial peptide transport system permease subunit
LHLESLQEDCNLENYINLIVVGISPEADKQLIIQNLQSEINATLGAGFVVRDLTPTLERNIYSLYPFIIVSIIVILIETIILIASLFFYQMGNFRERASDFVIIRGMGATRKFIKSVIFIEDLAIILVASGIAIGVSLIFNSTILYQDAFLPSLWIIFLIWILVSIVVILVVRTSIYLLYKELDKIQQEMLKDFSRAK